MRVKIITFGIFIVIFQKAAVSKSCICISRIQFNIIRMKRSDLIKPLQI